MVDVEMSARFASEAIRMQSINSIIGQAQLERSMFARCLAPLMVALDWFGSPRRLLAALPTSNIDLNASGFQSFLSELGYSVVRMKWREWPGGASALPIGSLVQSQNVMRVYLGRKDGQDWWHDGTQVMVSAHPAADEELWLVRRDASYQPLDVPQLGWLGRLVVEARKKIGAILLVSFVANLLALAISLFTMFVYNTVIPSGAINSLWAMAGGALIAVLGAWGLRLSRVTLVSRATGWAGLRISDVVMRKTLGLPLEVSARLGVENNLIRLRSLEGVRQWFGGGGGAISADYPFVLIFLIVIAILGGWIVFVPIVGLLIFALLSLPLSALLNARSAVVGRVSRRLGEFTSVLTTRLRSLRGIPGTVLWQRHLGELVAQSVAANRDYAMANALMQAIGQALSMSIVLGTMAVGIMLVLSQQMSTGGLIATMMLIWRVTTPAQQFFSSQVRIKQLISSSQQLDRLLASQGEAANPQLTSTINTLLPAIEADRLYYRHNADREPALAGVSFKLEPGQVLAVVGPNGAGKTTLLEVLSGVLPAQNGRVRISGRDIRQFDPVDYRAWHGYVPQLIVGLPLTLRQSVSLRVPDATDDMISDALSEVAGESWWQFFGQTSREAGLNVQVTAWREDRDAIRGRFIVRMAAAVLGKPPFVLLDDPLGDRDPALDPYLHNLIEKLRGKTTIVIATHRPDLIQSADMIAVLNDGVLAHFGAVAPAQANTELVAKDDKQGITHE